MAEKQSENQDVWKGLGCVSQGNYVYKKVNF